MRKEDFIKLINTIDFKDNSAIKKLDSILEVFKKQSFVEDNYNMTIVELHNHKKSICSFIKTIVNAEEGNFLLAKENLLNILQFQDSNHLITDSETKFIINALELIRINLYKFK